MSVKNDKEVSILADNTRFKNRVALITGAGSETGIGFAAARTLANGGAGVALTSTTDRIYERVKTVGSSGTDLKGYTADLMDRNQVKNLVDAYLERLRNTGRAQHANYLEQKHPNEAT